MPTIRMSADGRKNYLDLAQHYANIHSGCNKVAVGSVITQGSAQNNDVRVIAMGANRCLPNLCHYRGCYRIEKYGDDSKNHRNPEDCRAIHSEVDAICSAASLGISTKGATIYVTRYPCEACARALITAGIKEVYYGGTARISDQTADLFDRYNITCVFVEDWKEDNSDR